MSPNAPSPLIAEEILALSLDHPHHHFWPDEISIHNAISPVREQINGHKQITDAYLLGLTLFRQGKFATFDTKIAALLPTETLRGTFIEAI
jgi:predicted nucleic acid-binding protein